jgi:hypothetical protein
LGEQLVVEGMADAADGFGETANRIG